MWRFPDSRPVRSWQSRIALVVLAAATTSLSGCLETDPFAGTFAAHTAVTPTSNGGLRADVDELAGRYDRDPGEKTASIDYARALRALGRYSEASAVMRTAAIRSPTDYEVLGAYGKALADSGPLAQAAHVLAKAYSPDRPDWTIMYVQGAVADELGDHENARRFYQDALAIAPGEPEILNNLGFSYVLTKQLPQAERTLREAAASPRADDRVRNNLALVLALEKKSATAGKVGRNDTPANTATADAGAAPRSAERFPESSMIGATTVSASGAD